tara:strand:- start:186 stop:524 length:339 start_codon:yes stop_codon:yes gene_type:complete
MAFLKEGLFVILGSGENQIQGRVVGLNWRRFRRKNPKPNQKLYKNVPYGVVECFLGAPQGTQFVIPGYKLKKIKKDSEVLLILRDEYVAEFDGPWVEKMIAESNEKRAKKAK